MNVRKFKSLLVEKGFTLRSFSQESGLPMSTLSYIIKNQDTKVSTLVKICKVLDVEANVLLNSK